MKFLRLFGSTSQRDAVLASIDYKILQKTEGVPGVELMQGTYVPEPDYTIPFYIDVRGAVTLDATSGLQMSTDGETWIDTTATTLSSGKTYFRVADDQSKPLRPKWTEDENSDYDVGGNINSLVKVNFANDTNCYSFTGMFQDKFKLKSAGNLILPATTLANSCYSGMFQGCTSLTTAPALPATTLARNCYRGMFKGCTALTTAPVLPATILTDYCYNGMFNGCTSLTTAPTLPATTLAIGCYSRMFSNCTSLTTAPALPATTLANSCYSGMFSNCTSLTTAPTLPATRLFKECYRNMFNGCSNLNYIKCLATNISARDCTTYWVSGVAASGTFVKDPDMTDWTTGNNGIPSGWTVQDAA